MWNWILLHGDKKNTVIQGITQQRTLKFPHLREQGAILRYLDVDLSADHRIMKIAKSLQKCAHCSALPWVSLVILFNFSFSLWAQCEEWTILIWHSQEVSNNSSMGKEWLAGGNLLFFRLGEGAEKKKSEIISRGKEWLAHGNLVSG